MPMSLTKYPFSMTKMSLLGLSGSTGLIDCSASLPPAVPSTLTTGGGGPGKRGFTFSSPKFNAHPLKREEYKNFHKW